MISLSEILYFSWIFSINNFSVVVTAKKPEVVYRGKETLRNPGLEDLSDLDKATPPAKRS